MELVGETQLYGALISCSSILQSEGHGLVGLCTKWIDERGLYLVFFHESYLMVARVTVQEG